MDIHLDKKKFAKLVRFLRNNRSWPDKYQKFAVLHACFNCRSGKSKLKAIFRGALQSNNAGGLKRHAEATDEFSSLIAPLPNGCLIRSDEFMNCFSAETMNELVKSLMDIKGIGGKKAALFLRNIFVTQNLPTQGRIFRRRFISEQDLFIPLDIVIASILAKISAPPAFKKGDDLGKAFAPLNDYFRKQLKRNHMVIEDLWFWGYFGLKGSGYEREAEINTDKLSLDPYFNLNQPPVKAIQNFCSIVR